jgi:hypothetical protein
MANIFLSVPILGKPELKMIYNMYQAILSCPKHRVRVYYNENDSLISRVRNVHLSAFYNDYPECDYYMSIDSDIEVVNAYVTNNIFDKLISHDLDFVGGLYSIKKPETLKIKGTRICSSVMMSGTTPDFNTGLQEVRWLSSGCWCIKRSVMTKMIEAYPELIYDGDDNASGKKIYGVCIPMIYEMKPSDFPDLKVPFKKYLSEDWSMCERWRKIGGKIFADTSIVLRHIGKIDYSIWDVEVVKTQKPNVPLPGFDLSKK